MEYLGTDKPVNKIKPLVSVCVQIYQHASYIHQCLENILMQETDFPFEIILGEDESTDGTREICKEYAEKHVDKIRLILRNRKDVIYINGKPTEKFNLTENMKTARGKYIALCEGDDYWTSPLKIQKQVDFLEENQDCSLCFHSSRVAFQDGRRPDRIDGPNIKYKEFKFSPEEVIGGSLGIWTASMVFQTTIVKDLPDWYYSSRYSDVALRLICANKGKIGYIGGETMSVYRRGTLGSWSSVKRSREWYDEHLYNDLTILNAFNKYSNYKFRKAINIQKKKKRINYLLPIQDYCNKLESTQLIVKYIEDLMWFYHKTTFCVWFRFVFGKKNYGRVINFIYRKSGKKPHPLL